MSVKNTNDLHLGQHFLFVLLWLMLCNARPDVSPVVNTNGQKDSWNIFKNNLTSPTL